MNSELQFREREQPVSQAFMLSISSRYKYAMFFGILIFSGLLLVVVGSSGPAKSDMRTAGAAMFGLGVIAESLCLCLYCCSCYHKAWADSTPETSTSAYYERRFAIEQALVQHAVSRATMLDQGEQMLDQRNSQGQNYSASQLPPYDEIHQIQRRNCSQMHSYYEHNNCQQQNTLGPDDLPPSYQSLLNMEHNIQQTNCARPQPDIFQAEMSARTEPPPTYDESNASREVPQGTNIGPSPHGDSDTTSLPPSYDIVVEDMAVVAGGIV